MPLIDPVTKAGMSSIPLTTKQSSSSPNKPITTLQNDAAKIFRHLHPILLLSAYYFQFPVLVRDPVGTLLNSLVPLAVVQMVYVGVCLPVAGEGYGSGKGSIGGKRKKGGSTGGGEVVGGILGKVFAIITSLLLTQLTIPLLLIIQILFGAPLTTHLAHTTLSSSHFSLLAFFPLIYTHGTFTNWDKWRSILALECGWQERDEVIGGAVGVFAGAWLGAVPIPLDWDREWQRWPVTVLTGGYGGYVIGKGIGGWR